MRVEPLTTKAPRVNPFKVQIAFIKTAKHSSCQATLKGDTLNSMTEIILALIIAGLFGGLIYERREHSRNIKDLTIKHAEQIKELTSKITARNLSEYMFTEAKKPLTFDQMSKTGSAKESDLVDIDEAEPEEIAAAATKTAENLRKGKK